MTPDRRAHVEGLLAECRIRGARGPGFDAVALGECVVELHNDVQDVVGLSVHDLTHDEDTVALHGVEAVLAKELDPPPGFPSPRLGVIAEGIVRAGTPKHDRRGPHFADRNLVVVLRPLIRRAEMKVVVQVVEVVLVRLTEQEGVQILAPLRVTLQAVAKVGRVVVIVVGSPRMLISIRIVCPLSKQTKVISPLDTGKDVTEADTISTSPTSTPKCNTGHSRSEGGARAEGMAGRRGLRPPGTADPAPGRLWSLLYAGYPGFPGSATPPPGRVASVRAQGGRSPTGARTDAVPKSIPPPPGAAMRAGGRRSRGVREGGPRGTPRRASGSPAPGADARSGGPAPPSPPRR